MYVTVDAPQVVSNQTSSFGETFVVASGGEGATGMNARGGITISDGDLNPERIQIVEASAAPDHTLGDRLGDVTGVMSYGFDHYRLLVTEAVMGDDRRHRRAGDEPARRRPRPSHRRQLQLQDLDPNDSALKFNLLAEDIVLSLSAPDIIAVQEMQDGNGLNGTDPPSAASPRRC